MAKRDVAQETGTEVPFQGSEKCPLVELLRTGTLAVPRELRLQGALTHYCGTSRSLGKHVSSGPVHFLQDHSMLVARLEQMGRQEVRSTCDCDCPHLWILHGSEVDAAEIVQSTFPLYWNASFQDFFPMMT